MIKGYLGNMMKQAKEMQEKMKEAQEEVAALEVTGTSGAGMVTVLMTGRHDIRKVNIDQELLSEDKEILEDLLAAAVNDAVRQIEKQSKEKMSGMADGISLPPGFKLPF